MSRRGVATATQKAGSMTPIPKPQTTAACRGEQAVLAALLHYPAGLQRSQLTVLTGHRSPVRDAHVRRLRRERLIRLDGDRLVAEPAGRAALPQVGPLPTGPALQRYWMERLAAGERRILQLLMREYPGSMSRDALGRRSGRTPSSLTAYVGRLKARELVTTAFATVAAAGVLFDD